MYNYETIINSKTQVTAKDCKSRLLRGILVIFANQYTIQHDTGQTTIDIKTMHPVIEYHREPTISEIKFGYGATHYIDFEASVYLNGKGIQKYRLKCPIDGLYYSVSRN